LDAQEQAARAAIAAEHAASLAELVLEGNFTESSSGFVSVVDVDDFVKADDYAAGSAMRLDANFFVSSEFSGLADDAIVFRAEAASAAARMLERECLEGAFVFPSVERKEADAVRGASNMFAVESDGLFVELPKKLSESAESVRQIEFAALQWSKLSMEMEAVRAALEREEVAERAIFRRTCLLQLEATRRSDVEAAERMLRAEWSSLCRVSWAAVLAGLVNAILVEEAAHRDNLVKEERQGWTVLRTGTSLRRLEAALIDLVRLEAIHRKLVMEVEALNLKDAWLRCAPQLFQCRFTEVVRVEQKHRCTLMSEEAIECRQLHAIEEMLGQQQAAETSRSAFAKLAAMEAGDGSGLCGYGADQRSQLVLAEHASSVAVRLSLLPKEEAHQRDVVVNARQVEVMQLAVNYHTNELCAARAVMERRETALRRAVEKAEALDFKHLTEDAITDRRIAEATVAYRTNLQQSIAVPPLPEVLRQLQRLLEEEQDERELLLLDEVRVRRKRLPSAASVCGSQGGVDSMHEASVSQDARPRSFRDRNRSGLTNDALQRWVRFNR
jgi:hypothetical protein